MKYKCIVSYDGFSFNGYQKQKHDKNTIQEVIENVLSQIFKEKIVIYGSGRTDKQVHALNQVFHFSSDKNVPVENLKKACNEMLPESIKIKKCEEVDESFHARYSSHKKVYVYSTHQTESYSDNKDVVDASYYLKKKLLEYNVDVKIEEGNISEFMNANNYSYNYSYVASRYFVKEELKYNYDLVIDLHRDAVSRKTSVIEINDKNCARVMFVIGKKNKNYKKNYDVALSINELLDYKYPGLSRGIL